MHALRVFVESAASPPKSTLMLQNYDTDFESSFNANFDSVTRGMALQVGYFFANLEQLYDSMFLLLTRKTFILIRLILIFPTKNIRSKFANIYSAS